MDGNSQGKFLKDQTYQPASHNLKKRNKKEGKKANYEVSDNVVIDSQDDTDVGLVEHASKKKHKEGKMIKNGKKMKASADIECEQSSEEQAAIEQTQLKKEKRAKKRASENVEVELNVPIRDKNQKRNKRIKRDEKEERSSDKTRNDAQSELLNEERAVIETTPLKKEKRSKKMIKTANDEVELDSSTSEKKCSKNANIKKGQEDKTTFAKAQAGLEREILNEEKNDIGSAERGKKKGEEIQGIDITDDVSLDKRRFTLRLLNNYFKSDTHIDNRKKYTTLLFELMNAEMFVGSNFFSLQGYEE